jgi:cob(I)alamin adenosyltransferase
MAKVTTKSGDHGMTQLAPGRMASKTHPGIVLMGFVDELSCALGMDGDRFDSIQTYLSEMMGYMYYQKIDEARLNAAVKELEEYITTHNNSIPTWFVNPRGAVSLARAICRRVERQVVELVESDRTTSESERYMNLEPIIKYFNRLSDYLFVKSFERAANQPALFRDELESESQDLLKQAVA